MHIHELLKYAADQRASDVHLAAGEVPALRIDGQVKRLNSEPLSPDETKRLVFSVMNERLKARFEESLDLDFSIGLESLARFRVNVFSRRGGIAAVFRLIPDTIIPLEELELPRAVIDIASYNRGLVLVTGPTGSGKTTTLAALLDHINRTRRQHILTVEDPIEFVHTAQKCIINQREIGVHSKSFAAALRSALREDPDVLLVGEMRDLETMQLAMTAAETGHLVFASLHTKGAVDSIDRIIDAFPTNRQAQIRTQLASSLQAVVSQMLLPRKSGKGRVCAAEVMIVTHGVRNLIR
ncbi:MAG: type IV pilus twitching motility protein PilT, partial [Myxococcota bacterium]|nr:type IV pilus twitching motility protein PilT [Myxococcota bacterium]